MTVPSKRDSAQDSAEGAKSGPRNQIDESVAQTGGAFFLFFSGFCLRPSRSLKPASAGLSKTSD
jgi:hypothetical protein